MNRLANTTLFNSTCEGSNHTFAQFAFQKMKRLTNTTLFNSTNEALDYSGYAYNNGNRRTQLLRGMVTTNGAGSTNYVNYTYDPIGQLTIDLAAELIGSTNRMNEKLHYARDGVNP